MVTVMLMTLFLALVGLGLWAYAHALLTDAVGQAARYAANADSSDAGQASQRAADIMSHTLAGNTASTVHCDAPHALGVATGDVAAGEVVTGDVVTGEVVTGYVATGEVVTDGPMTARDLTVEVHCTMAAPGLVPLLNGLLPDIDVTAHALREVP